MEERWKKDKDDAVKTFRDFDGNVLLPPASSALEEWYIEIRDTKLAELDAGDLARACRQDLYIEAVIPFCLVALSQDPLAGSTYDGELVQALKSVSKEYWQTHPVEKSRFLELAKSGYQETNDADLIVTEDDLQRTP